MTEQPTTTDPTVANELAELQALAAENPSPADTAAADAAVDQAEHDKARAQFYCEKLYPFVQAWGSRLKRPLAEQEAVELTKALADVGVRIIPEHDTGPSNPWANLVIVSLGIAAPRIMAEWNDRRKAEAEQQRNTGGDGAAGSAPGRRPSLDGRPSGSGASSGDSMLDSARAFDADNSHKPH